MLTTILLCVAAQTDVRLELRSDPLVDLWYDVRHRVEQKTPPRNDAEAAALEAMEALTTALGSALRFGRIEAHLMGAESAVELAERFERWVPERATIRDPRRPREVELRAPAVRVAEALVDMEADWRETESAETARLESFLEETQAVFDDATTAKIFARMGELFGMELEGVVIPVYLVRNAPWPGGFTHRREGTLSVSFVAVEGEEPGIVYETVLHEAIHGLELQTSGQETLFQELRTRLAADGVEPGPLRDWVHTLYFFEAAACIREFLDPGHEDYGDVEGYYERSEPMSEVERPLWRAYRSGGLSREELLDAIVEAAGGV